jgi:hypothetical protein
MLGVGSNSPLPFCFAFTQQNEAAGAHLRIKLKVITRAKEEQVQKLSDQSYKIKVHAPPERGRANERVRELLSEEFNVNKNKIRIVSGELNNKKIVEIDI